MQKRPFRLYWLFGLIVRLGLGSAVLPAASTAVLSQGAVPANNHVVVSLIGETTNVVPGHPFQIMLRQQIRPGWHTYWSNPGEAGLPTTIRWSLPSGFGVEPISWPTPQRFETGPIVSYGYEGEVLLPIRIDVPTVLPGSKVMLSAHVDWLVCSEICVPEEADISLSVPLGDTLSLDPAWAATFAAARSELPATNPFPTTVSFSKDEISLRVAIGNATRLNGISFFPDDPDVIEDGATQSVSTDSGGLSIVLRRSNSKEPPEVLKGVLAYHDTATQTDGTPGALFISVPVRSSPTIDSAANTSLSLTTALLLAFIGGIVLNLMPCVLPVLSIKVIALLEHAELTRNEMRLQGLAYGAGVLASFAAIGGVLAGLRAAGAGIGWGFQLQSPLFVGFLIYLLFAVGLNLSGVFSIGNRLASAGSRLSHRPGYSGALLTGAVATMVATPCTAPFMATAIGYALVQPWYKSLVVLEAIGLGLSLPYLLITFSPRACRLLPKPGPWMLQLKEVLAFPVYATAVWLTYVLSQLTDSYAITVTLSGLVLIGFAAWIYNATSLGEDIWRRWGIGFSTLAVVAAGGLLLLLQSGGQLQNLSGAPDEHGIKWQAFDAEKLEALRAKGNPVFVDFTAAWCITCKVNERIALADASVTNAFLSAGIVALRADWTRQDPAITKILEASGRAGVPLYLFYPPSAANGDKRPPVVLPQILTASAVLRDIQSN
jgi:thiol:disulfide interchange protein/DsbC/DsbD-like thiol-disulfide interchange protein